MKWYCNCSLPCTHICNYNILMEFYPTLMCSSSLYNLAYDLVLLFGFLFCQSLLFGLPPSMGLGIVSFNSFFWSIAFQFFYSIVHPAFQFFCVLIWQPIELWNIPFFHCYFPWFTNILFEFLFYQCQTFFPPYSFLCLVPSRSGSFIHSVSSSFWLPSAWIFGTVELIKYLSYWFICLSSGMLRSCSLFVSFGLSLPISSCPCSETIYSHSFLVHIWFSSVCCSFHILEVFCSGSFCSISRSSLSQYICLPSGALWSG